MAAKNSGSSKSSRVAARSSAGKTKQPTKRNPARVTKAGMHVPSTRTGPVDNRKTSVAKKINKMNGILNGEDGISRQAGMMMDGVDFNSWSNSSLPVYRSSYASGDDFIGGIRDVPPYFVMMNEQNGGILYWPATLREKYEWYRYFARTDAYIGRAMELLVDLPMSRLSLNMPKMENNKKLRDEIKAFFEDMCDSLQLFGTLQDILWEFNLIGNCYLFCEWDEDRDRWSKLSVLPPEEIHIFQYPFSDNARVEYRPMQLMKLIKSNISGSGDTMNDEILKGIPEEVVEMVKNHDCIVFDSDPMVGGEPGSFVNHFARRKHAYFDLGASVLERVLVPMLMREHFKYTQLGVSSRNMTPKNLITASETALTQEQLDDLRTQVDLSYLDPEYSIVTNYPVQWEQIGADQRLLSLTDEYEQIERQIFAALGVTRELLTGEGSWSGNKITVEILNSMFMLTRQTMQNFVERKLFRPVCEAHGWYEEDKNGVKKYYCPKLGFNRLTIRDNRDVFDSLYQLYQKGSLTVDVIYDLFNLDTDEIHEKLKSELFTVKDSTFNRAVETINGDVGSQLVERTNIVDKIAKYLDLDISEAPAEEGGGFGGGFGDFEEESFDGSPEQPEETEEADAEGQGDQDIESIADEISVGLDTDATDDQISQAINNATKEGT